MRFVFEMDCAGLGDNLRHTVAEALANAAIDIVSRPEPLIGPTHAYTSILPGRWRFIAAPGPDPDGVSSPDLGMVMADDEGFALAAKP